MASIRISPGRVSLVLLPLLLSFLLASLVRPTTATPIPQTSLDFEQMGQTHEIPMESAKLQQMVSTVASAAAEKPPIEQPSAANGNAKLEQDTGQVTITKPAGDNATAQAAPLPIRATIFHGVPGPTKCRGQAMGVIDLPGTGRTLAAQGEQCFNLAQTANCGVFSANKADGCQARLFSEPGCLDQDFNNVVVFMPEFRAVGGVWKSMAVLCGVPEPDPATLGEPPLAQFMKKIPKKPKGGKGEGVIPVQPTV